MIDLETLANFSEIIGAIFVVGGVVFATVQIKQIQRQRKETAAIEMMRAWQDPEFSYSFYTLMTARDVAEGDSERLSNSDYELGKDAYVVFGFLESVGVMVKRGILPTEIAFDLLGGATITLWQKYEAWIDRARITNPRAYEWVEWLYVEFSRQTKTKLV